MQLGRRAVRGNGEASLKLGQLACRRLLAATGSVRGGQLRVGQRETSSSQGRVRLGGSCCLGGRGSPIWVRGGAGAQNQLRRREACAKPCAWRVLAVLKC